jgi:hypothetical protein
MPTHPHTPPLNYINDLRGNMLHESTIYKAVPWLQQLVASVSLPSSVHVVFVVDKAALGQVFLRVLCLSPVNGIPSLLLATVQRRSLTSST